jgi:hypothetical protein
MRIVTWDHVPTVTPQPVHLRLTPWEVRQATLAGGQLPGDLDDNTEAIIMAHPWRKSWHAAPQRRQADMDQTRILVDRILAAAPNLRAVFVDHPPPTFRSLSGGNRRSPDALEDFRDGLLQLFADAGVLAQQYGVQGPRAHVPPELPMAPVLWSLSGTAAMLDVASHPWPGLVIMPWLRGVGQWAPNGAPVDQRMFLLNLLASWACGASWAAVWFDPRNTTHRQRELMGEAIDLVAGRLWDVREPGPETDMDRLLQAMSDWGGGGDMHRLLGLLAGWGRGPHVDPDHPSGDTEP